MICTIRIPDVLQARIDTEAGDGKRSEWIIEACRMRLDGERNPAPATIKPDMQALRDICAGNLGITDRAAFDSGWDRGKAKSEVPICGKDWWEDGEHYECLMDKGHKEQKHGMRGMVRVIS